MARALSIAVASLALGGCLGSEEPAESGDAPAPAIAQAHRVQVQLEPGWQAAEQSLTPKLLNPKELLSVGTLPMKPGGGCGQVPGRIFKAMGDGDALISIYERAEVGRPEDYPPRPSRFRFDPAKVSFECSPEHLETQAFLFSDAGRRYFVLVASGRNAPANEVEAILNSFQAAPDPN